jgi:hypothetical protein
MPAILLPGPVNSRLACGDRAAAARRAGLDLAGPGSSDLTMDFEARPLSEGKHSRALFFSRHSPKARRAYPRTQPLQAQSWPRPQAFKVFAAGFSGSLFERPENDSGE